ncbi:NAD(P)/FAD-dependent oxidoreductase [Nocardia acidivorans]|uniref:NAD(P)/FAD-dependent oxidoreductase n=1 Tax=Nocardia acidivorans TaxID=404580 RepID=UPI00082F6F9E|nr:FAD-dependent oxidoreductase [Nocardia acidivorans]
MSINHHILVLGGGYAGVLSSVRLARRMRARRDVHVTLINPSPRFTERLRLHQLAAGQRIGDFRIEELLAGTGVEFICGTATVIDVETRQVAVETLGRRRVLNYDTLVYALGSVTDTGVVPGAEAHAYTLDSVQQAARVAQRLTELAAAGGPVTVCGGGLTGVETATEIAEAYPGLRVSLISRDEPGATMGTEARAHLRAAFDRLGVTVRVGTVSKVLPDAVEVDGTELLASAITLWTTGMRVPTLAAEAGIGTDARGLVLTDPSLRSRTHPDIYAAGDAAAIRQRWGRPHGTCQSAIPAGAHVADSIARQLNGAEPKPFRFGYHHRSISLGRHDGIVQFVRADDTPKRGVRTGAAAARYRERVGARPLKLVVGTREIFGLLRRTGMSRGGLATRKPYTGHA